MNDRERILEVALADLVQLCDDAQFDNGVHSPDGRSEADYWASGALDHARGLLRMAAEHQAFPEITSVLSHRLKYRLDMLIERAGTEEQAIVSRGIGIGYLFARELYKALATAPESPAAERDGCSRSEPQITLKDS